MSIRSTARKAFVLAALAGIFATAAGSSMAAKTPFDATHQQRAQVNHRLELQQHRIVREVREGEMRHAKATRLNEKDQQENVVSKQIGT